MQLLRKLKFYVLPLLCLIFARTLTASIPQEVYSLLDVCGIEHDGTLPSIVKATQSAWLMKPLQERWQLEEKDFSPEKKQEIRTLIEQMGFFHEISPQEQHYTYCLIGGATSPAFQKRLNYVAHLWQNGLRFDQLILLSGDRDLDPVIDKAEVEKGCKIEAEAVRFIYDTTPLPAEMRDVPVLVSKAPKQNSPHGLIRPSRAGTVRAWLELNPMPGNCLFITHQPYIHYDNTVAACLLDSSYPFMTAGPGTTPEKNSVALLLDTVARYLYQKLEYEKSH